MRPYNANPPIKVCHATTCYLGDSFRITGTKTFSNRAIAPINTAIAQGCFPLASR
ncbi:hypothetical protein [Coleofasciculus sp. G2-EDA-02]|uniref:hypothetical protein n=1 Tax=Coleofasciculus sp. G2-EDA-02 TaxID=3069529 RepID=UPI0032FEE35F